MTALSNKVSIKPFIEKGKSNQGLEKYGQALFDGTAHTYDIAAVEEGNTVRYITGLNPFAPEIMRIKDAEAREAKQNEIKAIVIQLEKTLAGNIILEDDKEWWNKVKVVKPDNVDFWGSIDMAVKVNNDGFSLDVANNTKDLIKYIAIKNGGVPEIALNMTDALARAIAPKFFLDEAEETATIEAELFKLRDEAGYLLRDLSKRNPNKFMYVCKVVDANSVQYKKSTPPDVMYVNMSKFLDAGATDSLKKQAFQTFIDAAELDLETLKLRALIKDASTYKLISLKGDGMIYEMATASALGKNPSQVLEHLKNPLNEEVTKRLLGKVEEYWKK